MRAVLLELAIAAELVNATDLTQDGDLHEMTVLMTDATVVTHDTANAFAQKVGDQLKALYPSRVLDPRVDLKVYKHGGQQLFRITWSCRIVRSSVQDADWLFDRRGSLKSGATIALARAAVDKDILDTDKVNDLRRMPNGRVPENFVRESRSGSSAEGFWFIREYFGTAPKPK